MPGPWASASASALRGKPRFALCRFLWQTFFTNFDAHPREGEFVEFHNIDVHSSKGGFVQFFEPAEMFFTGDEWRNITWLVISARDFSSPAQGASTFVVRIPEPATLALIGIGLVGFAFIRRRTMSVA